METGQPAKSAVDRLFVFAVPLVPKRRARDWQLVLDNLQATLRSMLNQIDQNYLVLIAAEDAIELPELTHPKVRCAEVPPEKRLEFDREDYDACNSDAYHKRALLTDEARKLPARYIMYCDADDLVSNRLVGFVRDAAPETGCVITHGFVMDHATGKVMACPSEGVPVERFDTYCGSCIIFNLDAPLQDKDWPVSTFMLGHLNVRATLAERRQPLLDADGPLAVYVVNSGQNISSAASNKQGILSFNAKVAHYISTSGHAMTKDQLMEFGLWS
jgi:hypothetical protein